MKCERCAGLVVPEQFIGGTNSNGGWAYSGWRCVNCGAIDVIGQAGVRAAAGDAKRPAPNMKFRRHESQTDHR